MIQAQSADGVIHQFPDGTDPAVVDKAMKAYVTQAPAAPKRSLVQNINGTLANINRGLGIGDELAAGINTAKDVVTGNSGPNVFQTYRDEMANQRKMEDSFTAAHPYVAALARGAGMAGTVAIPAGDTANLFAHGNLITNAARGATQAGLGAAAYAAADRGTLAERAHNAASAARNPVVLGLGAAGGALATRMTPRAKPAPAMNLDELKTAKTAAYDAADKAGVAYTPQAFNDLASNMTSDLEKANLNPIRHPRAASMLSDIQDMAASGQSPSLTQVDQLRQVVRRDVANAPDKAEQFMGRRMINQIDRFVNGAGPGDVTAGNAADASNLITAARDLNTRLNKVETVTNAVTKAVRRAGSTGSGGNADNAIRQNLRQVLEKSPNLTDEEGKALESIVMGGRGQNLLRLVGKLSPSGNGLMAAGNLGAAALGGPLGALPGAAGLISKLAADGMTRSKVAALVDLMSRGGSSVPVAAAGPAVSVLPAQAAVRLSRAAAIGATGAQAQNVFARHANP